MTYRSFMLRWMALAAALIVFVMPFASVSAQTQDPAIDEAVAYIRSQQQPDGSFAGFGPASTADAVFALSAAGVNVAEVKQGGKSAIDYIRSQARTAGQDVGVAAKFVIALLLAGQSPLLPDGTNLVQQIESGYTVDAARYGKDVTSHAYALIALRAAGQPSALKSESVDALKRLQLPDGGWSFDGTRHLCRPQPWHRQAPLSNRHGPQPRLPPIGRRLSALCRWEQLQLHSLPVPRPLLNAAQISPTMRYGGCCWRRSVVQPF